MGFQAEGQKGRPIRNRASVDPQRARCWHVVRGLGPPPRCASQHDLGLESQVRRHGEHRDRARPGDRGRECTYATDHREPLARERRDKRADRKNLPGPRSEKPRWTLQELSLRQRAACGVALLSTSVAQYRLRRIADPRLLERLKRSLRSGGRLTIGS